ncbi:MAG: DUF2752 domain-containing protein [Clostridiales bacterium]|jgi:hypothetical protein|nr:DUF2752 domain-containing protein [Clostridiales bacterium]
MAETRNPKEAARLFSRRDALMRKRRALLSLIALAALILALLFIKPEELGYQCPFLKYLNVYCPACGLTRAAKSALYLRFGLAMRYNAFFTISLPFLAYAYIACFAGAMAGKKVLPKAGKRAWLIFFALFLAFGVVRNFEIFSFLAPPAL